MGGISALHGILLRFAAALVCVAACEGLLRPAALSAWTDVQARANGANQLKAAEEIPARQRGVRVVQHGGYPELQVDGKPFFITSAEFCYPRVPRKLWEVSLDRYRELGINTITLSIPWNWHEPREGEIDFDGHTLERRNLRGLLRLIASKRFRLIARSGPIVTGEWRNGGYPDWLLERPEYHMPMADRLEGLEPPAIEVAQVNPEAAAGVWLANPTHMKYAQQWLEAVAHELVPYRAGATVRVAAEEPAGTKANGAEKEVSGPLLFVQVGDGLGSGSANPAGTEYWKYVETLCGAVERGGIDAPCLVDTSQGRGPATRSTPSQLVAATGHWSMGTGNDVAGEDRRLSPLKVAELESMAALLASQSGFPPVLTEFSPGWFAPEDDARPALSPPENIRRGSHLFLGFGLRGLNWFPLQDSLTPAGYGTPDANRFFRWDAALTLNGSKQPAAREAQRIGDWLRVWGSQVAASHRRADFGLVDPQAALPAGRLTRADITAIGNTTMQIERLARYANMSAEVVDPQNQPAEQLLRHALLLFPVYKPDEADYALNPRAQGALEDYVRGGGVLVCFPGRPSGAAFEEMQRGTLMESVDQPEGAKTWRFGAGRFLVLTRDFYSWVSLHEDFAEGNKRFEASFAPSVLEGLLKTAGVQPAIRRETSPGEGPELVVSELVSNEGTLPLGGRSGGQGWVSVVNLSDEKVASETLEVLSPRVSARRERGTVDDWIQVPVTLPPREALLLPIEVGLCLEPEVRMDCEDRVISSSAELGRVEREKKAMFLSFYAPTRAEVRIHLSEPPEHVDVDESQADAKWSKTDHTLVVKLLRGASPQYQHVLRVAMPHEPALPERPKAEGRRAAPAHFRFSPAGGVRLPLGTDAALLANPPLFVFRKGEEGSLWVLAENLGGQGGSVQVETTGQFNASTRAYASGNELRSINLKLPASAVEKATEEAPAADGLYHGTLHFAAGSDTEEFPVSYAILPEKGAARYQFDFDGSGSADWVLETSAARAILSPGEGGRMIGLVAKSSEGDLASTMGLLEDVFTFTPKPQETPRERARDRAGTFNRSYSAEWVPGEGGPTLQLRYEAPDVYPHGASIEKSVRFTDERTIAVEYHVSLPPADARRIAEETAGRIFAAQPQNETIPQSFAILNSIPASARGARGTELCWKIPAAGATGPASADHCERFEPGGATIAPPAGVRQIEFREARRPGIEVAWETEGARVTLEQKNYSVLVRLAFPPLDAGGAAAAYRIEFSVKEAP